MKSVALLGSTGSIGTQALEVARQHKLNIPCVFASTTKGTILT